MTATSTWWSTTRMAAPALLRNDTPSGNHWIRLNLVGSRSNRDAMGAQVEVELAGRTLYRQRKGGASLESAHDPRLLFGLGKESEARKVIVHWPSGSTGQWEHLQADASYELTELRTESRRVVRPTNR